MGQYLLEDRLPANFDRDRYFNDTNQARWFVSLGRDEKARKRIRIVISSAWVSKCQKLFLGPNNIEDKKYLYQYPYLANTTDFTELRMDRGHPKGITFHSYFLAAHGTEMAVGNADAGRAVASSAKNSDKKSPIEKAPTEKSPIEKAPTEKSPIEKAPTEKSPIEKAPEKPTQERKRGGKTFRNMSK
jgi:hypothetical protein